MLRWNHFDLDITSIPSKQAESEDDGRKKGESLHFRCEVGFPSTF